MLVEELGEFGLIDRIKAYLKIEDIEIPGPGDDTAILPFSEEKVLLFTADMLLEDVHFNPTFSTPYQVGWKSIAANLSDIASMGGLPRYALISLGLASNTPVEFVDELYRGMEEIASHFGLQLVGGDTNRSEKMVISVALLGECEKEYVCKRSGAKVGDKIVISGFTGESEAGLICLKRRLSRDLPSMEAMVKKHLEPYPRLNEARRLAEKKVVCAMIDLSDGLSNDLHQLTKSSGVSARIFLDRIPISEGVADLSQRLKLDPFDLILYGGEDYELLFTTSNEENLPQLEIPLSIIGEIILSEDGVLQIDKEGRKKRLPFKGYRHF